MRYGPLDMTGPCTRKFMAIVDVYTRPDQSKQHFIEDKEGTREVSSIAEKLLALNDCWGCHFSLGVRPLMGCPNSGQWTPPHAQVDSTYWTQWDLKKKKKGDEVETMVFYGDFGRGGSYVQGTLLACINQAVRMFLNI